MSREHDSPALVAARTVVFGVVVTVASVLLLTKPVTRPYALGAPLFALGLYLHLTSRRLEGRALLAGTLMGLGIAASGALVLATRHAVWTGAFLGVIAVAGALRVPALLGRHAPPALAWVRGRETALLTFLATLALWAVGRTAAGPRDDTLVDWMAVSAALVALGVLLAPRARDEWDASPCRRHEQRIVLRPDPRAEAWRGRAQRFVEDGEGADAYRAGWREALVRGGLPAEEADAALADVPSASRNRILLKGADVERRRRLHASLVERLPRAPERLRRRDHQRS